MSQPAPTIDVDLSSCDREAIHIPGRIQDIGFLVAVASDWTVRHVSANSEAHFGVAPDAMLGVGLDRFIGRHTLHDLRGRLQVIGGPEQVERLFAAPLRQGGPAYDFSVHFSGESIIIEGEPTGADVGFDAVAAVKGMMARLNRLDRPDDYLDQAARQMRTMLGFARVMVYRFDHDGSGLVVAESVQAGMAPFKGLRYPASDIPKQARDLYRRNWLRLIADTGGENVPILPALSPEGEPLDLSFSALRSVSPIHIEYLRNMGVTASLSVSIMRRDQLWGLFACHHTAPRPLSFQRRTAAELFGQLFSLQLESREQQRVREYETQARRTHEQVMASLSSDVPLFDSLDALSDPIRSLIPCDGLAICSDGRIGLHGRTPTQEEILGLLRFLHRISASRVYATSELGRAHPPAADYAERAAGLIAIPISRSPRDYILFFRPEQLVEVTWAGDPTKPAQPGPNGLRLTPRKSFDAWRETVRGQAKPWAEAECQVADSLRVTLLEVIVRLSGAAEEARKSASDRQDLLIAELNHRVRNILGLIRALVARSRESAHSLENFVQVLSDRIFALAQAHDLLTADHWRPISLRTLLNRELDAYLSREKARVKLVGPPVMIVPQAFSVLALVFHELTTNAAKYGALSSGHGEVTVTWSLDDLGALVVNWRETGGPPVRPPSRQGFGTTIIERSIPYELEGEAEVRYEVGGLRARFLTPARFIEPAAAEPEAEPPPDAKPKRPVTLTGAALVVEDNALIAFDAEEMLRRMGFGPVEIAGSASQALELLAGMPDLRFVLLDMNLGTSTSVPVAQEARRRGIPFVFASGYGEQLMLPEEIAGSRVIGKPYRHDAVERAAMESIAALR